MLFPELGLDLVEEGEEEEEYSITLTSASWQENWLFKRGRGQGGEDVREGVTMLVANPMLAYTRLWPLLHSCVYHVLATFPRSDRPRPCFSPRLAETRSPAVTRHWPKPAPGRYPYLVDTRARPLTPCLPSMGRWPPVRLEG